MRPTTPLLTLAAGVLFLGQAAAEDETFDLRLKEATRNLESEAGRKYGEAFSKEFGPQYAPRLSKCLEQTGDAAAKDFDVLLNLGGDGRVEKAMVWPETKVAVCFRDLTKQAKYPAPPSEGYWHLVAMRFSRSSAASAAPPDAPVIIAYLFPQERVIDPAEIAAEKLTHINYAFADIKGGKVALGFSHDAENFKVLAALRKKHPHLRILVSVGGWTWSGAFSDMALTPKSRLLFVESAVDFVRRHDLDGFDVDWEYPGLPGNGNTHRPEDTENFTALMAELRAAFDAEGRRTSRRYLLTFAAGASEEFLAHTEVGKVQSSVDFVNLMTYDFREAGGDPLAGHHANLLQQQSDPKKVSADRAVREFLAADVLPEKLVLGVPFYGRAWGEVEAKDKGLYQRGKALAEPLDTKYPSLAALVGKGGWVRVWDDVAQAPFLWNAEKRTFVSYEDPESLRRKCRYVREMGLAGVMFWEYTVDSTGELLGTLFTELRAKAGRK